MFFTVMLPHLVLVLFYLSDLSLCDERSSRVKRIVGGIPAEEPPADDPTVFTNFAGRSAIVQGVVEFPHYVFRGIKYAYAPVGKDRFLRPREKLLKDTVNATVYAPPCIQPRPGTNQVIGSEDCLALNIFTPTLPTGTEGLPVVIWIHGGGFRYGSASQYGVRHLVGKRLVVVTIQYRLGSLGFLSSGTKHLPGNVALWDMVLAVQWVRNYIGFFGGNPYKITVMGHDTGASSALMLALSNVGKGLVSGVIAMSGTAVSGWATDNTPQHTAKDIAIQNGCPTGDPLVMVKCLQSLPPESIIRGDSNVEFNRLETRGFMAGLSGGLGTAPVTEGINDGRALPGLVQEDAMDEMGRSTHPPIPLLTGICKDETKRAIKGPFKQDVVQKIKTIPNFMDNILVQNLKSAIPLKLQLDLTEFKENLFQNFQKGLESLDNIVSQLVPPDFTNYMKVNTANMFEALDKVADVTNDALFNVPAFLTVDKWSNNGARTYLYSFDHVGKNKKGNIFLRGSPLVGNGTYFDDLNDTVAHGDDLAYIFVPYDVEGNPLDNGQALSEDDLKVQNILIQIIADFAKDGAPKVNNKTVTPFSPKKNNFIQIKPEPTLADNFKFCEMALWCNIAERLKSTACQFLDAVGTTFKNMQKFVIGLKNQTNLTPDKVLQQITSLQNLTSQGINIFNQNQLGDLSPDKVFKEIDNKVKDFTNSFNKFIPNGGYQVNNGLNPFIPNGGKQGGGFNIFGGGKKQEPVETKNAYTKKPVIPNLFGGFNRLKKRSEPNNLYGSTPVEDPLSQILGGKNADDTNIALFKNEDFGTIPRKDLKNDQNKTPNSLT